MAYTTTIEINKLKRELGITDDTQDAKLVDLLEQAAAFIDAYCGRTFSNDVKTITDELYERQGRVVWLRNMHVNSVTAVKAKLAQSDDYDTLAETSYEWTTGGRLCLPLAYDYVQVSYTHGALSVPADIIGACIAIAAESYRNGGEHGAIKREELGALKLEYAQGASTSSISVLNILDRHRVRGI